MVNRIFQRIGGSRPIYFRAVHPQLMSCMSLAPLRGIGRGRGESFLGHCGDIRTHSRADGNSVVSDSRRAATLAANAPRNAPAPGGARLSASAQTQRRPVPRHRPLAHSAVRNPHSAFPHRSRLRATFYSLLTTDFSSRHYRTALRARRRPIKLLRRRGGPQSRSAERAYDASVPQSPPRTSR